MGRCHLCLQPRQRTPSISVVALGERNGLSRMSRIGGVILLELPKTQSSKVGLQPVCLQYKRVFAWRISRNRTPNRHWCRVAKRPSVLLAHHATVLSQTDAGTANWYFELMESMWEGAGVCRSLDPALGRRLDSRLKRPGPSHWLSTMTVGTTFCCALCGSVCRCVVLRRRRRSALGLVTLGNFGRLRTSSLESSRLDHEHCH